MLKRQGIFILLLAVAVFFFCGCGEEAEKAEKKAVAYDSSQDELFLPEDIFDKSMYVNGLVPVG